MAREQWVKAEGVNGYQVHANERVDDLPNLRETRVPNCKIHKTIRQVLKQRSTSIRYFFLVAFFQIVYFVIECKISILDHLVHTYKPLYKKFELLRFCFSSKSLLS